MKPSPLSRQCACPSLLSVATAGALALGISSVVASAALTYDLRVTGVTGEGQMVNRKSVTSVAAGDVVSMDLFAVVTGADGNAANDGFQSGFFNLLTGAANGNLAGFLSGTDFAGTATGLSFITGFDANGSQRGQPQQLGSNPSDGFGDIGSTSTAGASIVGNQWIRTRAGSMDLTGDAISTGFGIGTGVGQEFKIGFVTFRVSGVTNPNGAISLNFQVPAGNLGLASPANWMEDGVAKSSATTATVTFNSMGVTLLAIPEPSAFGMVLLGAMGILGFRRGARRV